MNRRDFLKESMAASAAFHLYGVTGISPTSIVEPAGEPGITVLLVDTDRITTSIDPRIYGEFLEHINHSVEDGLFAEQIRGAGFEGEDFKTYWEPFADAVRLALRTSTSGMAKRACACAAKVVVRRSGRAASFWTRA